jgi:hypothetical protein
MKGVGAYDDLVGMTYVFFEFMGIQNDVHQNRMCFVEIDDFQPIFCKGNGGVRQYIFDRGDRVSDRLYLDGFYS